MNWKLILGLSMFGLVMGLATVFLVPSKIEPVFWLVIFIVSAVLIARACSSRYFLHGLLVGLANCVWIVGAHILFFNQYSVTHHEEMAMMQNVPMADSPRLMMAVTGPVIGLVSGAIIGLFAFIASKFMRPRTRVIA